MAEDQASYQLQADDDVVHLEKGRPIHSRYLREETIEGTRILFVQSLSGDNFEYPVPAAEIVAVSRVVQGEATTHYFD